jgi:hypothetical protein
VNGLYCRLVKRVSDRAIANQRCCSLIGPRSHRQSTRNLRKILRLRTRETERLHYDKIDSDPYAKRVARRVASTPARQSNPVSPSSRAPQVRACRLLDCLHLAVPRAHGTSARRRFRRALCRNRPAPHLNLSVSQLPCLTKSAATPSSSNRFTATCRGGHGM